MKRDARKKESKAWKVSMVIDEGRNRQVRRMVEHARLGELMHLKRVRIGSLRSHDLGMMSFRS